MRSATATVQHLMKMAEARGGAGGYFINTSKPINTSKLKAQVAKQRTRINAEDKEQAKAQRKKICDEEREQAQINLEIKKLEAKNNIKNKITKLQKSVLDCIAQHENISVAEIAEKTNFNRTSVVKIITNLEKIGFINHSKKTIKKEIIITRNLEIRIYNLGKKNE